MSASSRVYSFPKGERDSLNGSRNNSPSPGQYDINSGMKVVKEQSPEWTFGRNFRQGSNGDNMPGPGQNNADVSKLKTNISFSMGTKQQPSGSHRQKGSNPGPGTYDSIKPSKSPSFTMGGRTKEQKYQNTPGPGTYDLKDNTFKKNHSKIQQSHSQMYLDNEFSKSQRASTNDLSKPGPGAYSPNDDMTRYKNPTFGFGKGHKGITSRDLSPGPGAYEYNNKEFGSDTKKISMGGRPQTATNHYTPGPGAYDNLSKTIGGDRSQRGVSSMNNKGERISSPTRDELSKPGPGAYDVNNNFVRERTPDFRFGNGQRQGVVSKEMVQKPGPGQYDVKNNKKGPFYKIGQKVRTPIKNDVPGPGNYNPNHDRIKESMKSVKIVKDLNKTKLTSSKSTNHIGPGAYQVTQEFGKTAPKVSIKGRPKDQKAKDVPGPGQYDPRDSVSKERVKSTIIKGNPKQNNYMTIDANHPGPGMYHKNDEFGKNATSYTFKGRNSPRYGNQSPGPGAYEPNHSIVKEKIKNIDLGSSKRQDLVPKSARDLPGPGIYENSHKSIGKDVPSFSMKGRRKEDKVNHNPGPGAYDAKDSINRDKSPSFRMSSGKRQEIVSKSQLEKPGPGSYELKLNIGNGPLFSFQPRNEPKLRDSSPGPGNYDPNEQFVKEKIISYKMGSSQRAVLIQKEFQEKPGPGAYESQKNFGENGRKYTMGKRSRSRQEISPGPGQYEPSDQIVRDRSPVFKMSSSTRNQIISKSISELPGPGAYDNTERFGYNAQKVSIRGKREEKIGNDHPGPGQYDPSSNQTKDRVRGGKIDDRSKRPDIVTKEMLKQPGPGEYDSPIKIGWESPSITIRGRPEDIIREKSPGPGKYDPQENVIKERVITYKMPTSARGNIVSKDQLQKPGPGMYEQKSSIGQNTYTYTMGGKAKEQQDNKIPGPGTYDPKETLIKETIKTQAFSKTQREEIVSKEARNQPGPGNYTNYKEFGQDTKSVTIRGRPQDKIGNDIPGPGNYDLKDALVKETIKTQAFSKSTRQEIVSKEEINKPGPGNYSNYKEFGSDAKSVTIRGRPQEKIGNDIPGPGNYDPNHSHSKERVITYKMGTTSRTEIVHKESMSSPGPGTYDSPSKLGQNGPKYTFNGRNDTPPKNNAPGPGQYDLSDSLTRYQSPSVKITSSSKMERFELSAEKLSRPGPGTYDQHSHIGQGKSFMIRGKPSPERIKDIPGPGTYDAQEEMIKERIPAAKIGKNKRDFLSMSNEDLTKPGPGNYDVKEQRKIISYTIGTKEAIKYGNDIPGPGTYNQLDENLKHRNPSANFSRSPPRSHNGSPRKEGEPGPGQYEIKYLYDARDYNLAENTTIKYSIPRGEVKPHIQDTPGPGTYKLPSKFADVPSYANISVNEEFKYV